jgi:pentatricopeptide repeat protein
MQQQGVKLNVTVYNSVLKMYLSKPDTNEVALSLFNQMKEEKLTSSATYNLMLQTYVKQNNPSAAFEIYNEIISNKLEPNIVTYANLLKLYVNHDLPKAEELFKKLKASKTADLVCCTIMLSAYGPQDEKIQSIRDYMKSMDLKPDKLFFQSQLRSRMIHDKDLKGAAAILEEMETGQVYPDTKFYQTLLVDVIKEGTLDEALMFFDSLRRKIKPTAEFYKILMMELAEHNRKSDVYLLFETALESRTKLVTQIYNLVMETAARNHDYITLMNYWTKMQNDQNVKPNSVSYSIVLEANIASQNLPAAEKILHQMVENRMEPTAEQFAHLISLAVSLKSYTRAVRVITIMRESTKSSKVSIVDSIRQHAPFLESLIVSCSEEKPGTDDPEHEELLLTSHDDAKKLNIITMIYREFVTSGIVPSEEIYQIVLEAYRKSNDLVGCVQTWQSLSTNYESSPKSVSLLLQASLELGQVATARAILELMRNKNYPLSKDSHEYLVLMTTRWKPTEVIHLLLDMINAGHSLDPQLYSKIMSELESAKVPQQDKDKLMAFIDENFPELTAAEEETTAISVDNI